MGAKLARLSMRVAGKWQRHTSTIYIPARRFTNRVLESVKSPAVPRLLIPTYYSAVVARRYLKSDMSSTNVVRRRRMSRESLTVGFLLLFEEPSIAWTRVCRICDSSRFALRFISCRMPIRSFRFSVANVPEFHGDELSRDVWPESTQRAISLRVRRVILSPMLPDSIIPLSWPPATTASILIRGKHFRQEFLSHSSLS